VGLFCGRSQAVAELTSVLAGEAQTIEEHFAAVDEYIGALQDTSGGSALGRVAALTAAKGRHLALGCYSLILDGLAQESGALLRPLIEAIELLVYLSEDSQAVDEAVCGKLPKAGEIARKINGRFKPLREHLNANSSHFDLSYESLGHIVQFGDAVVIKTSPRFEPDTLKINLETIRVFLRILASAAERCLALATGQNGMDAEPEVRAERA
jgi:hypothetical protein